jgi:uncharacterized protein (DUF2062 family)
MKKLRFNPVRSVIERLKAINAHPMKICYGFAFGVFMSTTPLIGIKWMVALPIVWILRWSKVACLIGVLQVNYLTGPIFYALAYFIGKGVCGYSNTIELPELMSHKKALILNVASVAAFGPLPYKTIYPASKAYIYSFSRSLSR